MQPHYRKVQTLHTKHGSSKINTTILFRRQNQSSSLHTALLSVSWFIHSI